MIWWAMWCAALVAGTTWAAPSDFLPPIDLPEPSPPDDEGQSYGQIVSSRIGSGAPWLYLLEFPHDASYDKPGPRSQTVKRRMPSLSIDLPMSVLRQKLNLEKVRKIQAQRAIANRSFLNDIGKRGFE